MAKIAPFLIASLPNLLPSYFFPFTPINIDFSVIFFEFIEAKLIFFFILTILDLSVSFKIFVLIDFDRFLFLSEIDLKISILSEKNLFFLYS